MRHFADSRNYALFLFVIIGFYAHAQIDVHQEPLHHPVFTNGSVRILDIIANPGDTSLVHKHANNYCYVTLNGGTIWSDAKGTEPRTVELKDGFVGGYFGNPSGPLTHRFANRSAHPIRFIAVENLSAIGNPIDSLYKLRPHEEMLIHNAYFLVTRISLKPNERLDLLPLRASVLINTTQKPLPVISKNDSDSLDSWIWVDPNRKISLRNPTREIASVVLVQVKK